MNSKLKSKKSNLQVASGSSLMEELLARAGQKARGVKRGDVVEARVVSVSGRQITFDLGGKSEGVVEGREYDAVRGFAKDLSVGDKVRVTVVIPETRSGLTLVSLRGIAGEEAWKKLEEAAVSRETVTVSVRTRVSGGLSVEFLGVSGFIPMSQIGEATLSNIESFISRPLEVVPIEVDKARKRALFSEREVSEGEELARQRQAIANITRGEVFPGEVVNVVPFGVFVRITKDEVGVDGLIHSSRLLEPLEAGKKIKVRVLGTEGDRLALAPDLEAEISKYQKGDKVRGKLVRTSGRNLIIELPQHVSGLLANASVPPGFSLRPGEEYDFFVELVDQEKRRITLGLVLKEKPVGYK